MKTISEVSPRPRAAAWISLLVAAGLAVTAGCRPKTTLSLDDTVARARLLLEQDRTAQAAEVLTGAIEGGLTHPDVYYQRGLARERMGLADDAQADYTLALQGAPQFNEARNNRGVIRASQGEFEAAIEDFTEVLAINPDFTLAYKNRGLAYHDLKRFDAALSDFDALVQRAADAESFFLRGNLRLEQQDYERALADFDQALERDKSFARAWLNRGVTLLRQGRIEEGKADLRRSAEADSETLAVELLAALESAVETGQPHTAAKVAVNATPSSAVPPELVQRFLESKGWRWTPDASSSPQLSWIEQEGQRRRLLVVRAPLDGDAALLDADVAEILVASGDPPSLLIARLQASGDHQWQFVPRWRPARSDFQPRKVSLQLPPASNERESQ